jgi:hypothetical protein
MSNTELPPPSGAPLSGTAPQKNFSTVWLLSLLLGVFGVDHFYLGKVGTGVVKLISLGGFGIWYIIDLIFILTGSARDKNGLPLANVPDDKKIQWIVSAAVIVALIVVSLISNANEP